MLFLVMNSIEEKVQKVRVLQEVRISPSKVNIFYSIVLYGRQAKGALVHFSYGYMVLC